jgi:acyl-CoA thioesterase-1
MVMRGVLAISAFVLVACQQSPNNEASKSETPRQKQTQAPSSSVDVEGPVIVFLGDSLTAGLNLSPSDALPEQVSRRLREIGQPVKVINAGVSGDTSANGLARYDWSVKAVNPDFLIVALGANDYLQNLPPESTRSNLSEILNKAETDNFSVILVGQKPRSKAEPGSRDAKFGAIYPDLANQFNLPLYPALMEGVQDNPDLLQADGLHPTAEGVEVMANRFATFLTPLIK